MRSNDNPLSSDLQGAPAPASTRAGSELDPGLLGFRRWDLFSDAHQGSLSGHFVVTNINYDKWKPAGTPYDTGVDHFNWKAGSMWPDTFFLHASNDGEPPGGYAGGRFETYTLGNFGAANNQPPSSIGNDDKFYQLYRWQDVGGTMSWVAAPTYLHRVQINGATLVVQKIVWYTTETLSAGNNLKFGGSERLKFAVVSTLPTGSTYAKLEQVRQS